mmetsp:Transcript_14768/g.59115  ORF Transcript_14768/g.59115 Transcript_14768/m.59115 type:complete len:157 (+) Transcript_14768:277-747(+)
MASGTPAWVDHVPNRNPVERTAYFRRVADGGGATEAPLPAKLQPIFKVTNPHCGARLDPDAVTPFSPYGMNVHDITLVPPRASYTATPRRPPSAQTWRTQTPRAFSGGVVRHEHTSFPRHRASRVSAVAHDGSSSSSSTRTTRPNAATRGSVRRTV